MIRSGEEAVRRDETRDVTVTGRSDDNEVESKDRRLVSPRRILARASARIATLGGSRSRSSNKKTKLTVIEPPSHHFGIANSMYVVAHPDDSLLFQSPSLVHSIESKRDVVTVHLSAGDNGLDEGYWLGREAGIKAAYARMAQVENDWTPSTLAIRSHRIHTVSLTARINVRVVFMRLPDGGFPEGTGTVQCGGQSLMLLWQGKKTTISAVDRSASYDRQDLIDTLSAMMHQFQPQFIAVQDYVHAFGNGDHMDHYAAANFSRAAHKSYESPHDFVGFAGYQTASLEVNVSGAPLAMKQEAFYTYGGFDSLACTSADSCSGTPYAQWLQREYVVGSEPVGVVANAD